MKNVAYNSKYIQKFAYYNICNLKENSPFDQLANYASSCIQSAKNMQIIEDLYSQPKHPHPYPNPDTHRHSHSPIQEFAYLLQ